MPAQLNNAFSAVTGATLAQNSSSSPSTPATAAPMDPKAFIALQAKAEKGDAIAQNALLQFSS
jgi:hypothetical protein